MPLVSRPPSSGWPPTSRSVRSRRASCWRSRATRARPSLVTDWTVETLGRAIAARKISPVEATRACLDRIERLDGRIHAFITIDAEGALATARTLETELAAGRSRGPLHGVPLAYKDLCHVPGLPTSCGTTTREYFAPSIECTATARLRDAGAVTLGKLNMTELAMGPFGDNAHHGDVQQPRRSILPADAGEPGRRSAGRHSRELLLRRDRRRDGRRGPRGGGRPRGPRRARHARSRPRPPHAHGHRQRHLALGVRGPAHAPRARSTPRAPASGPSPARGRLPRLGARLSPGFAAACAPHTRVHRGSFRGGRRVGRPRDP